MGPENDPFLGAGSPRKSVTGPQAMRVPISGRTRRQGDGGFARILKRLRLTLWAASEALHPPYRQQKAAPRRHIAASDLFAVSDDAVVIGGGEPQESDNPSQDGQPDD